MHLLQHTERPKWVCQASAQCACSPSRLRRDSPLVRARRARTTAADGAGPLPAALNPRCSTAARDAFEAYVAKQGHAGGGQQVGLVVRALPARVPVLREPGEEAQGRGRLSSASTPATTTATRRSSWRSYPVPFQHFKDPNSRSPPPSTACRRSPRPPSTTARASCAFVHRAATRARPSSPRTSTGTLAEPWTSGPHRATTSSTRRSTCASASSAASRASRWRPTATAATTRPPTSWPWRTGAWSGTCRLLFRGDVARLGRLAVEPDRRGAGSAAAILREADRVARGRRRRSIALHAQTYAAGALPRRRLRGARRAVHGGGHRARGDGEAPVPELRIDPLSGCA